MTVRERRREVSLRWERATARTSRLTELGLSSGGEVEVNGVSSLVGSSDGGGRESSDGESGVGLRAAGDESGGDAEEEKTKSV